ncbi:MAG: helix-turn-helix transcriptional regulator [Muribaculaceae bacterium]|nr:helix-turn-helix transcriptional regulator [Muribaculaceae bacterium]
MNINELFGKRVKEYRLSLKLSQEALANLAEIDRTYLPKVERGERNVSLAIAQKIADALNVKLSKLLEDE